MLAVPQSGLLSGHAVVVPRGLHGRRRNGGETVFFSTVSKPELLLGAARPKRGRLVVFRHTCPHAGLPVEEADCKLFLRGELHIT